ncbi:MAG: molybdopterin-dependent oxidoreductase [Alphaproteobacteria bacterium]|nr:molybdopterin-dependent oxidoreductase [Alphaproteobacteria bacterium]
MAWKFPRLSRRAFIASTGAGSAALTLLKTTGAISKPALSADSADEYNYGICNFCSSLCNLRITTRTNNGVKRIVKLDGNPNSTLNRGKICARGQAGLRQTYDTDRLKTPMIRVEGTKRGEFSFRPATWEEAFSYIATKTKAAKIQPWEWTMVGGWTSCIFYMNWAVPFAMANGIPNIVASPMQHCVTTGHLGTDAVTGNFNVHDEILPDYDNAHYILFVSNNASIGAVSTARMVRFAAGRKNGARVVALDSRRSETAAKADEWICIRPGTDLDFMLAMLGEMLREGYYNNDFLVRHTNMPFLVYKDEKGQWQLANDAEGRPQVVDQNGTSVRSLPAFTNDNTKDVSGVAVYPALMAPANLKVGGKSVVTALQAQTEECSGYTPEWAERTTGIKADVIRRISREFGTTRPAIVDPGWHGARYGNVMMLRRVQAMVQSLTGGIDVEGGWIMSGEFHHKTAGFFAAKNAGKDPGPPLTNYPGLPFALKVIDVVSKPEMWKHGHPGFSWAFAEQERNAGRETVALPAMADYGLKEAVEGKLTYKGEPYKIRALLINAANPVRHYYPDTNWKDILSNSNMELVIAIDVLPSDTTPYADVLLPSSTYLERSEPTLYGNGVNHDLALVTRYAPIDTLYDTRESPDLLYKMTEIISGNVEGFLGMIEALAGIPAAPVKEELAREKAKGLTNPFTAACRTVSFDVTAKRVGVTVAELDRPLRDKGVFTEETKKEILEKYAMPWKMPVPSLSGRVEFFSGLFDFLGKGGNVGTHFSVFATAIPATCRKDATMDKPLDKDEFYFTYGKVPTVSYGSTNNNNPVLSAINNLKKDIYTGIWIHPDRAEALNIAAGDGIKLTNTVSGQSNTGFAYITRLVHRDALFIYSAFGVENPALTRSYGIGTATNKLIPYQLDPVVGGFRSQEFTIRVAKISEKGGRA